MRKIERTGQSDLVLIYQKPDADTLRLVRSGRIRNSGFDFLGRSLSV